MQTQTRTHLKPAISNTQMFLLQWNLNGYYTHLEKLQILLAKHIPKIVCLQETHFKGNHCHSLRNYTPFFKNRLNREYASGGVATYVSSDTPAQKINLNTTMEAVAVRIQLPTSLTICNIYIPPDNTVDLEEIRHIYTQMTPPMIFVGDFNCHNILWGCDSTSEKGRTLESFLQMEHLIILNSGEKTRFNSRNGSFSALDLSFCSPSIAPLLNWERETYLYGSDHYPILIKAVSNQRHEHDRPRTWNIPKANWNLFALKVEEYLCPLSETATINQLVANFTSGLVKAANEAVGRKSNNPRAHTVPWWNKDCEDAIRESKAAFNRVKRRNTEANLSEFKRLRARARFVIKQSKKSAWQEYVQGINNETPVSEVWSRIRKLRGVYRTQRIDSLLVENEVFTSPREIADALAKRFQLNSKDSNFSESFLSYKEALELQAIQPNHDVNSPVNEPLSMNELDDALRSVHDTSPGSDEIPYIFLKNLPAVAKIHLLSIFNKIWHSHDFPVTWLEAVVVPILKPDKEKTDVNSYRPISLTCCMCKLMERIVNKRLTYSLEERNLLAPLQNGFRHNRSTTDNLVRLESYIHDSFANDEKVLAVFFDVQKAYEMTWRHLITKKLYEWGFSGNILHFVTNFLKNRSFRVRVGDHTTEPYWLQNGIPQGSVISVTLFLIAFNDIPEFAGSTVEVSLYADDLVMYVGGKNVTTLQRIVQKSLSSLEEWTSKTGFLFSGTKTHCMLFSKRKSNAQPSLTLAGSSLRFVSESRFLGVTFDNRLEWKSHLLQLKTTCRRIIDLMKVLAHHYWGADTNTLLTLYRTLIRSKLDYGCVVYNTARKKLLGMLDTIQYAALRVALGAFRTSPVDDLCSISAEAPLDLRRKQLTLNYAAKVASEEEHPNHSTVFSGKFEAVFRNRPQLPPPIYRRVAQFLDEIEIPLHDIHRYAQKSPPWLIPKLIFDTHLSECPEADTNPYSLQQGFLSFVSKHRSFTYIYTDTSKADRKMGSAVYTSINSFQYRLSSDCSVFTGELYAILQAVKHIKNLPDGKYAICSDSLASINSIHHLYSNHPLIQEIHDNIIQLPKETTLMFLFTPSHVNIHGNEMADSLAREASSSTTEPVAAVSLNDIKTIIRGKCQALWEERWTSRASKLREIKPSAQQRLCLPERRRAQVIISRLRIGHTRATHLHLILKTPPPVCDRCGTRITVEHIIIECPKYSQIRAQCMVSNTLARALGPDIDEVTRTLFFLKEVDLERHL